MLGAGSRIVPGFHLKSDFIGGRYRVEKLLGVGSGGFVVAARHIHLAQRVALKVLTAPGAVIDTDVAATLDSPNIARILDAGTTEDGYPFVATERLEGDSLETLLAKRGPFSARDAVKLVMQACAGLAVAHAAGVVHGDLKPQNLFLTTGGVLKILDFGTRMPLSSQADESSAAWFASPAYLAPEQLREPTASAAADIWALGVILHELVAGKLPFEAETIAGMLVAVAYDEPALLAAADVPYDLAKIVHGCLAKNPSARPADMTALARSLAPFTGKEAPSLPPQLAMTMDAEPDEDPVEPEEHPVESRDVLEAKTDPGLPGPLSRMSAALKATTSSRPPPLPVSRLGAKPRAPKPPRLPSNVGLYAKGWLAMRLRAAHGPDTRTAKDRDFARRRWGAVGVVGAAAVLAVASLFASAPSSSSASAQLVEDEPGSLVVDEPAGFTVLPFVPPTFALRERDEPEAVGEAPAPVTAVVPPLRARFVPRPRLAVHQDPYAKPGFTHPSKLH